MVCLGQYLPHQKLQTYTLLIGRPCDENGNYLPAGTPPPPWTEKLQGDWTPFDNEVQFKVADFLYH